MLKGLASPDELGRQAAWEAHSMLGARKVASQVVPVVFSSDTAAELLGQFMSAARGDAIWRQNSCLRDRLGDQIAHAAVEIVDDPCLLGGLNSRPFDDEGIPSQTRILVQGGKLINYRLGTYSSRKLKMPSNGGDELSNLFLRPGTLTALEIFNSINNGLYVLGVSGPGYNRQTGDYSRGAYGLWIENGQLAYPVSGITIAGNILDMFQHVEIGSELKFKGGTNSPMLKFQEMTVAGT